MFFWPRPKLTRRILLFPLSLFLLFGCYNNSHIRTSKLLEEGEKVVSFSGSLNIAPEGSLGYVSTDENYSYNYWDNVSDHDVWRVNTGLAGLRGEMAILRGYKNSESGLYGGVGLGGGSPFVWHVGLEYKKYINLKNPRPFKAGINIELNRDVEIGTAIHSIQTIKTTTSKENRFYGGVHSIYTYGSQKPEWRWRNHNASYNFLMKGLGITLGIENFSSIFSLFGVNSSTILQIDASLLSSKFLNLKGVYGASLEDKYPTISASLSFNFFNTNSKKEGQLKPLPKPRKDPVLEFDPESGDPIKKPPPVLEFDPETGEPVSDNSRTENKNY